MHITDYIIYIMRYIAYILSVTCFPEIIIDLSFPLTIEIVSYTTLLIKDKSVVSIPLIRNKTDKSTSNSLNPSTPRDLLRFARQILSALADIFPIASGRILAERFCIIGNLTKFPMIQKNRCKHSNRFTTVLHF